MPEFDIETDNMRIKISLEFKHSQQMASSSPFASLPQLNTSTATTSTTSLTPHTVSASLGVDDQDQAPSTSRNSNRSPSNLFQPPFAPIMSPTWSRISSLGSSDKNTSKSLQSQDDGTTEMDTSCSSVPNHREATEKPDETRKANYLKRKFSQLSCSEDENSHDNRLSIDFESSENLTTIENLHPLSVQSISDDDEPERTSDCKGLFEVKTKREPSETKEPLPQGRQWVHSVKRDPLYLT